MPHPNGTKVFAEVKTGAFEVVAGDDPRLLLPESLKTFDALFLNGLHDPQPFLEFVMQDGKGIAGIEGSIAALADWKEFGEMMGPFTVPSAWTGGRTLILSFCGTCWPACIVH